MSARRLRWSALAVLAGALVWGQTHGPAYAQGDGAGAATSDRPTVLGPGLYVFQTRTRDASCGDSEPDGYVLSYFAAIHGIPHSISMTMELMNTPHFKEWSLKVANNNTVQGTSRMGTSAESPESHFEVKLEGDRFKGTGYRAYYGSVGGKRQRCRVNYDALLRRLDG